LFDDWIKSASEWYRLDRIHPRLQQMSLFIFSLCAIDYIYDGEYSQNLACFPILDNKSEKYNIEQLSSLISQTSAYCRLHLDVLIWFLKLSQSWLLILQVIWDCIIVIIEDILRYTWRQEELCELHNQRLQLPWNYFHCKDII
jgi:hypothetical protein